MACVGVSADVGFDAPALDSASLCGFKFPPIFKFSFGFVFPGISFDFALPIPYIALTCDLNNPVSAGFGGGRMPTFDAEAFCDDEE